MSPWSARLLGAVALIAGATAGACLAGGVDPVHAGVPTPPDPWTTSRRVPVRLDALEGYASVTLEAAGRREELWRQGAAVAAAGAEPKPWRLLELPPGADGWRVGERLYPGTICVEPAPDGGLRVAAWLDLEDYVAGVVAAEVALWSAPPALLEAQAIAARSYAVASLEERARRGRPLLVDGVIDQAYRGTYEPEAGARTRGVGRRLWAAIEATRGQVLAVGGAVVDARFHGACGGGTASFADVFGAPAAPAQTARPCPPCAAEVERAEALLAVGPGGGDAEVEAVAPYWTHTFTPAGLAGLARRAGVGDRVTGFGPHRVDPSGRWLDVALAGPTGRATLPLVEVRRTLGWSTLKSGRVRTTWPRADEPIASGLFVSGFGAGHGVGLCQRGSRALADAGWSARRILGHYYLGASILALTSLDLPHR